MAIPEHNISGKPWKWWSSYLRPLVHHKWGKRCLSEREKFTVLLEAAAALIYTAASCSAVLLQRWLLGLPQPTRRCTKWYTGGRDVLRKKCQHRSVPSLVREAGGKSSTLNRLPECIMYTDHPGLLVHSPKCPTFPIWLQHFHSQLQSRQGYIFLRCCTSTYLLNVLAAVSCCCQSCGAPVTPYELWFKALLNPSDRSLAAEVASC